MVRKRGKRDYLYQRAEPKRQEMWREVQFVSGMGQHDQEESEGRKAKSREASSLSS